MKLKDLFCRAKQKQIETLTKENELLKEKLVERQEVINKTNAYYKRLLHNKKTKK